SSKYPKKSNVCAILRLAASGNYTFCITRQNIPKKETTKNLLSLTLSLWLMGVYERINHQ
ncbi:MAG: hypothetical protein J6V37_04535, partial [Clostridia bacterium]|nr:hypothetical protein [Clostridia bacterium]